MRGDLPLYYIYEHISFYITSARYEQLLSFFVYFNTTLTTRYIHLRLLHFFRLCMTFYAFKSDKCPCRFVTVYGGNHQCLESGFVEKLFN